MAEARIGAPRVGVIVNPIAGMGGTVALHGTDGDAAAEALRLGARPAAGARMRRALAGLAATHSAPFAVLTAPGDMGEHSARDAGVTIERVLGAASTPTTADDTRAAAASMREAGVDLILFAGGDGTAADIVAAVGDETTILGIPSGVKMHSGVFAHTPESAGRVAAEFLAQAEPRRSIESEVIDVVAGGTDPARISLARVPRTTARVQGPKISRTRDTLAETRALGREIAAQMRPATSYILGPGSSVGTILTALGLEGTRNGFDIVRDGELVARDVTEAQLDEHLSSHPECVLVLGVVGGQGFLLGRGNQQVSPRVLAHFADDDIIVIAAQDTLDALHPPVLHVDLGSTEPHVALRGYRSVRTSPTRSTIVRVEN